MAETSPGLPRIGFCVRTYRRTEMDILIRTAEHPGLPIGLAGIDPVKRR